MGSNWSIILSYSIYIDILIVVAVAIFILNFLEILTYENLRKTFMKNK
jgi:hypothetical protein